MLTVSQAHIKHNLIVVVDGSWPLSGGRGGCVQDLEVAARFSR
jgi:hypothetical protein